jgi:methionine-rich copper-binding protein CopC
MQLPGHVGRARPGRLSGRWLVGSLVLAVLAIAASVWLAVSPADAPDALASAQPAPGARLHRAPDQVVLRFARATAPGARTTVVVLSPEDENLARGRAAPSTGGVARQVTPLRERGAYQVSYEVVSPGGQTVRGSYWFFYAAAPGPVPTWLGLPALVLMAAGAALAIALLQRRRVASAVLPTPASAGATVSRPVPAQRSRDQHEGLSPPGRRPRPGAGPQPVPEKLTGTLPATPSERSEPRQG